MHNRNKFILPLMIVLLANCGGSGGSNSNPNGGENSGGQSGENTNENTGSEDQNTDSNEKAEEEPENLSYRDGKLSSAVGSTKLVMNNDGNRFEFRRVEEEYGLSRYNEIVVNGQTGYGVAVDGDYVNVIIGGFYNESDGSGNTDYRIVGELMPTGDQASQVINYSGWFAWASPTDAETKLVATPMIYEINFDAGSFTGYDFPEQALIFMDGSVEGNRLSGIVQYFYGQDSFEGGIFGPEGQEIAGALKNGEVSVIFYGEYMPPL